MASSRGSSAMSSSADISSAVGGAALTFAVRAGRTVLVDSHVRAPVALVRPFPLADGGQLVQLITIGPGLCGGDRLLVHVAVETGARVVLTTPAATRVLSMDAGQHAEQDVELVVAAGATLEYYPAITIAPGGPPGIATSARSSLPSQSEVAGRAAERPGVAAKASNAPAIAASMIQAADARGHRRLIGSMI